MQFSPLLAGTGFVHVLFLDWVPVPHVALHVVHVDHKLKPPSTDDKNTAINTEYLVVFIKNKTKQNKKNKQTLESTESNNAKGHLASNNIKD